MIGTRVVVCPEKLVTRADKTKKGMKLVIHGFMEKRRIQLKPWEIALDMRTHDGIFVSFTKPFGTSLMNEEESKSMQTTCTLGSVICFDYDLPWICHEFTRDFHSICLLFIWDLFEICQRFAFNLPKICPKTCSKYAQPEASLRFNSDYPVIFLRCA